VARLGVHEYLTRHYQNRFYFRTEDVLLRQNQSQDGPRPRSREERNNFDRFAAWRTSRPDVGTDLNFSEGTRPCLIADDTVIKIDEVRMEDPDPLAKLNFYHWHPNKLIAKIAVMQIKYVFWLMTASRVAGGQRIFRCDRRSTFRPLARRGSPGTRKMSNRRLPPWSIAATTSSRFPPWYCRWRADSLLQM